jgi:plasmid stability protein
MQTGAKIMANLTIRNLDDSLVERLKKQAKANNRSVEAEVREILSRSVWFSTPADLRPVAERIAAMTPHKPQTDSVELLREDRRR